MSHLGARNCRCWSPVSYTTLTPNDWGNFRIESESGTIRELTSDPALDYRPGASPDGRRLVFTSERAANSDSWILDVVAERSFTTFDPLRLHGPHSHAAPGHAATISPKKGRLSLLRSGVRHWEVPMPLDEFGKGLSEMYQGELVGEAFFSELTRRFDDPDHRYKLATLLQLETETAARLRPAALELGLDLSYLAEYRRMCEDFLEGCEGMDWDQFMVFFRDAVGPFVQRYAEIAEKAPPEYKDLAESMVIHERAIETFARLECSGDSEGSLDEVIQQLHFPLRGGS